VRGSGGAGPFAVVMAVWIAAVILLAGGALAFGPHAYKSLAEVFFGEQDLPIAAVMAAIVVGLRFARVPAWAAAPQSWAAPGVRVRIVLGLAALSIVIGWLGARVVMQGYGLSMDEFMAGFDARILGRGRLLADVPAAWRPFVPAMQPIFRLPVEGGRAWASSYLPVNAGLQALTGLVGDRALAGPLLSALGVLATYGVARRIWPERPDVAVIAAVLLATSSQLLVTAMTPYAMSGHLALNMAWLWLALGRSRAEQAGAAGVAWLACGLHQLLFNPMFAAPFILWFWLDGRRGRAMFHAVAYALILAFWTEYVRLAAALSHVQVQGAVGSGYFAATLRMLVGDLGPTAIGTMSENLLRLLTWQNPLTLPLALVGVAAVRRRPGLWPFVAGIGLTLAVVGVLMPYQGHGWGYRYLHGLLGSLCLLAGWGWAGLTDRLSPERRGEATVGFVLAAAASLVVLLPMRAWQAHAFVAPYAAAERAIQASSAPVVVVDPRGLLFGDDLARNDPWLERGPKVLDLRALTPALATTLRSSGPVALFDARSPAAQGLRRIDQPGPYAARMAAARAALGPLSVSSPPSAR